MRVCSLLCAVVLAMTCVSTRAFGQFGFTPLPNSVFVNQFPESAPFLLADGFTQQLVTSRFQNGAAAPVGLWWDMISVNLDGPEPGRYLFVAYEASFNAGVGRVDLNTSQITTIAQLNGFHRFDGSLWTPWGTVITGEETTGGFLYEITNPLAPVGSVNIVRRSSVGRSSLEGLKIDSAGNLYYIDEFNGGSIYKFVPTNPLTTDALASGQIFALDDVTLADGVNVGTAVWIPLNDINGNPLPGITSPLIDARAAANNAGATDYFRPEDLELSTLASGNEVLYVATTTTDQIFSIELINATDSIVRLFVWDGTIDAATGLAVDAASDVFANPDNLAIDANGQIYIVEDNSPGDIWAVHDADGDGVAESIARWASLSTIGAEPTGLYFDPLRPSIAYVNAQHPSSGNDSLFRILGPAPATCAGDANADGMVNFADITDVLSNWLADYTPGTGPGDANGDGMVNFGDITAVLGAWLVVCP